MRRRLTMLERHRGELFVGTVGVALSVLSGFISVSPNFAWLAGSLSAAIALGVVLIKEHVSTEVSRMADELTPRLARSVEISDTFAKMGGDQFEFASKEMNQFLGRLREIENGHFPLGEAEYYRRIIERMEQASPGSVVIATSCIDERRWSDDPWQLNYMAANKGALNRGIKVRRVFILDRSNVRNPAYADALQEIDSQLRDPRMDVNVVWRNALPHDANLFQDWVLFDDHNPEVYQAYPDHVDKTRVSHAKLIKAVGESGTNNILRFRNNFDTLRSLSITPDMFRREVEIGQASDSMMAQAGTTLSPPGSWLKSHLLDRMVVTCEEAASAKNIRLPQELKTLIVSVDGNICAVHVRGNQAVSLRKLKRHAKAEQAHLISKAELANIGLVPGTVCPLLDPVWSLQHYVDGSIFNSKIISTNNGTLSAYFMFKPSLLTSADKVKMGDFSIGLDDQD